MTMAEKEGLKETAGVVSARPGGVLLSEISHDLKTYLNPIIGFSSVLLQDAARLQEDQLRQVKLVYESARRLLDRIDALVELLRLREGVIKPSISTCDCRHICQAAKERLLAASSVYQVDLQVDFSQQELYCRCDVALLVRAITEIILHRLPLLKQGNIHLTYDSNDSGQVEFFISDDGPDLGRREREALEKFLFEGISGQRPGEGIGLWLLLAAEAAKASRARIRLGQNQVKFVVSADIA